MKTKRMYILPFIFIISCLLHGCATSHFGAGTIKRGAVNTPDYFVVGFLDNERTIQTKKNDGCRNPMVDPRNGKRLHLIRSSENGHGDYHVPTDSYGVEQNELLRIDCSTGLALGIVGK